MVREMGLEPTQEFFLQAPQACASAIPPPSHCFYYMKKM